MKANAFAVRPNLFTLAPAAGRAAFAAAALFAAAFAPAAARAAAAKSEAAFLARTRQLTFEGKRSGEGYFSPDGKQLIFQSERADDNPFYQIFILDLESGDSRRVSTGAGKTTCAFFRPGTDKVMFSSTHLDPATADHQKAELEFRASGKEKRYSWDYDPAQDIFEANRDGSGLRRLTTAEGYDAEGSYSPDGSKIVFCSMRAAYPADKLSETDRKRAETDLAWFGDIYIMDADGGNAKRLTDAPGYDGGPFFSPDGKRIVWRRFDDSGVIADIYTMAIDGSDQKRVTNFGSMSWAPYYHPSGDYIIFASNKLGFANFELFMVDAAGTREPVRVTFTQGFDGLPVFSPDGTKLAWTSQRHGGKGGQLYLANWNDAAARAALAASPLAGSVPASDAAAGANAGGGSESGKDAAATGSTPAAAPPSLAGFTKEITQRDLRADIGYLASDALEGRLTGTPGERLAADYIEARFKAIGLAPAADNGGYRQAFDFIPGVKLGEGNKLARIGVDLNPHVPLEDLIKQSLKDSRPLQRRFKVGSNFLPVAFSDNGTTQGLVAFVGYGLVVPGENGAAPAYNSYAGLDVRGRVVVALRYVPEGIDPEKRQLYNRYSGLRFKALQARERGAAAMLVVSGPNSAQADSLVSLELDVAGAKSGLMAASINVETAEDLLAGAGKSLENLQGELEKKTAPGSDLKPPGSKLKQLQDELDSGEKKTAFHVDGMAVKLTIDLKEEKSSGQNVLALLPASPALPASAGAPGANSGAVDPEVIIIGAHYDHLGRGAGNRTLAHKGEEGEIHHGADDNASGVAALLEIAQAMAADPAPRPRAVLFAAWSGEEIGLLGSANFTKRPVPAAAPLSRVAAYLNMDMVGRVRDNKFTVQSVGSSPEWRKLIERKNARAGFSLSLSDDPYLPTDSTSFYLVGVPALHFFSGAHEDYHRPTDTADKINYEDAARVAEFVRSLASELAGPTARPGFSKVVKSSEGGGDRETLRAYIGTIPDYTTEGIDGVKLSGVRGGGPADKAGLTGGDVVVEFAGRAIKNIYDFTYALDAVKIGVPVKVVVTRDGKRVELRVTPEARK